MRMGKCQNCSREDRLTSLFSVNHALYCEPCANTLEVQLKQQKAPLQVTRPVDATICGLCGLDSGRTEFPLAGRVPLCQTCHPKVYNRDYPGWLKAGFALTLVLLVVALVHGAKYFKAGRQYFSGERLISKHQYSQAVPPLQAALAVAPECPKCRLLLAQANLLSGNPEEAFALVKGRNFEADELAGFQPDFDRADRAISQFNGAIELYEKKNIDAALAQLQEVEKLYPEWPEPAQAVHSIHMNEAFDRKDFDTFLQMAQADWDKKQDSSTAGLMASALACKYAITGQPEFSQRAQEMFATEGKLAITQGEKDSHAEFADRLHYRLTTREIVDKEEYDRRFRKKADAPEPKADQKTGAAPVQTQPEKTQIKEGKGQ
jgi:Tetratricopeptide repeat